MYPHNNGHSNTNTVLLEAPEYDPDINSNNNDTLHNPISISVSAIQTGGYKQNIPELLDALTIQIPSVSSTTVDALLEIVYHHRAIV